MVNFSIIQDRWQAARKITGFASVITLAGGQKLAGHYILTESGAATPSHNVFNGFAPSVGFPTDKNGGSVNDRDYYRDADAQRITREIARNYDARALQNVVIVSRAGAILSGNGRTMAGELAAHNNTDGDYLSHLCQYCQQYGFTQEQVTTFAHARVLFELADSLPYTAETFALFNAQEMKSQSKTEQAVKYGKLVDDTTFNKIVSVINAFETLSDFYQSTEAALRCLGYLRAAGVLSEMQTGEMTDGESISLAGREILENVLIGKVFATDPDSVRRITSYKSLRRSVIIALGELANNFVLSGDFSLCEELSEGIALCYQARKEGDYKEGEKVSSFARQMTIFEKGTVADSNNAVVLLFADILNGKKESLLRRILAVYNHQAIDAAAGQTDMFCQGGVLTKQEILKEVQSVFATRDIKEQNKAVRASISQRVGNSTFLTKEQLESVVKGSYVEFACKAGDTIICEVARIAGTLVTLIAKGGINLQTSLSELKPTASHALNYPEWLKAGSIITDGRRATQRIEAVTDGKVIFEWLNGGFFETSVRDVLQNWQPSGSNDCYIWAA